MRLLVLVPPDGDVRFRVFLSSDGDPGTPAEAESAAGLAFDDWLAGVQAEGGKDPDGGVVLRDGHAVALRSLTSRTYAVLRKSTPLLRDAVCYLSRTGAVEGAGPPFLGGRVPDGEWMLSRRTGRWSLEADLSFRRV